MPEGLHMLQRYRFSQLIDKLLQITSQTVGAARAKASGADVAKSVRFLGLPLISLAPGSNIVIGEDVVLCSSSRWTALGVSHPVVLRTLTGTAVLSIGRNTGISGGAFCAAVSLDIGERCLIGADVIVTDTNFHSLEPFGRQNTNWARIQSKGVRIGNDVFIGARSTVLKGVQIGDGSVIGAESVVSQSIPERCIAAGNPARVLRML